MTVQNKNLKFMKTIKTKQKKKVTIRTVLLFLGIDPNKKINIRELIVEVLSLYILTILVTSIVQVFILDVDVITFRICLAKSAVTNIMTAIFAMLGLSVPRIKSSVLLSALSYAIISIPYTDSFIVFFREGMSIWLVLLIYLIAYFILGFFIQRFLELLRNLLTKIINGGRR